MTSSRATTTDSRNGSRPGERRLRSLATEVGLERQADPELAAKAGGHTSRHGRAGTPADPGGVEARHGRVQGPASQGRPGQLGRGGGIGRGGRGRRHGAGHSGRPGPPGLCPACGRIARLPRACHASRSRQVGRFHPDHPEGAQQGPRPDEEIRGQLRSKLLAAAKADRREGRTPTASPLAALEDQISVLTELERDLKDEATRFTGDTKKLGSQAVEMESIQDEISSAMEMAKLIGNELEILKLELNAPDRIKLLKEAKAPERPGLVPADQVHRGGRRGRLRHGGDPDLVPGVPRPEDRFAGRRDPRAGDQGPRHRAGHPPIDERGPRRDRQPARSPLATPARRVG